MSFDDLDSNSTAVPLYSRDQIDSAYYVQWVFYPILLVLGTVGNVLNITILLAGVKSSTSTTVYLAFVAVADLFVLWLQLPRHILNSNEKYIGNLSDSARAEYETPFRQFDGIQRWGLETAIQLSDWTLLIFSSERLVTTLAPMHFRQRCSAKTAIVTECLLLSCCLLFTIYNPIQSYYCMSIPDYVYDKTGCIENTEWLTNWAPLQKRAEMGVSVFKYVAIVLVNSALLCVLCRSWHSSTNLKRNHQPQRSPKSEMYLKSGAILCASTALYLSAQLPMLVFNMRIYSRDHGGGDGYPKSSQLFATPFVQMAFLANYSLNFYLYFTVSTRFRDGLRDICRRGSRFVQSPNTSATALSTIPMSTSTDFLARTLVLASGDQFMSDTPLALETTSKEAKTTQDERDIMHEDDATPPPQRDRIEPRFSIGNVDIQR